MFLLLAGGCAHHPVENIPHYPLMDPASSLQQIAQNTSQVKNHEENEKCFYGNNREIDDHDAARPPLSNSIP